MVRWLIKSIALLLLLIFSVIAWLIGTESGFKTVITQSQKWLPQLQIASAKGKIIDNVDLNGIQYHDAYTQLTIDNAQFSWQIMDLFSAKLTVDLVSLDGITIKQTGTKAQQKSDEPITLPTVNLPLAIELNAIHIGTVTIIDKQNNMTPIIKQIDASLALVESKLSVNQLIVTRSGTDSFNLKGMLALHDAYPMTLAYQWAAVIPDAKTAKLTGHGRIEGDMVTLDMTHQLTSPVSSEQHIVLKDVLDSLQWQADLTMPMLTLADFMEQQQGVISAVKLHAQGDLTQAKALFSAQVTEPNLSTLTLKADATSTDFERWNINSKLSWPSAMTIDMKADISDVSTQPTASMIVDWQQLAWPIVEQNKRISSPQGKLQLTGNAQQFKVNMTTALRAQQQQFDVVINAKGSDKKVTLTQLEVNGLGGTVSMVGDVLIDALTSIKGTLKINDINPGLLATDWPGRLSGGFNIAASLSENLTDVSVDNLHIKGYLRDRPLQLDGDVTYKDDTLRIPKLALDSGQSRLIMQGSLNDSIDMNWQLKSPDLSDFYPDISGELTGDGSVTGKLEQAMYRINLLGKQLAYGELMSLEKIDSQISVDMRKKGVVDANLTVSNLSTDAIKHIDSQLTLSGTQAQHQLNIDVNNEDIDISTQLEGGLEQAVWLGHLDELTITLAADLAPWRLTEQGQIRVENNQFELGQQCLTSDKTNVCFAGNYLADKWQITGLLKQLPMSRLYPLNAQLAALTGEINSEFELVANGAYPTSGKGQLTFDDGRIDLTKSNLDSDVVIDLSQAELRYELADKATRARLTLQPKLEGVSTITGSVTTSDIATLVASPETAALDGFFETSIKDLSVFDGLTQDYEHLKGALAADIRLTGTVKKPLAQGRIVLDDTSVDLSPVGLSLREINAEVVGGLEKGFTMSFSAKSGEGQIAGAGDLVFTDSDWRLHSTIKGDKFEVINVPEIYAIASPDLTMTLDPASMMISGKVSVPIADIQPTQFNTSVSPSNDVVIVNNKKQNQQKADSFPTHVDVQLILGDEITIKALGFTGRLTGDVLATGNASEQLLGKGQLTIKEGVYNAYGNKLAIDDGHILFSGGPIDNPALDIKAIKKAEEYQVGVHILGAANDPEIKLLSTPVMSNDEILAYLVLGKPLAQASVADAALLASAAAGLRGGSGDGIAGKVGLDTLEVGGTSKENASLELGKNLSPNLYVGYGIGIFDSVNTINIRYKLNKIWSLRAESGQGTGVDLLYTHER